MPSHLIDPGDTEPGRAAIPIVSVGSDAYAAWLDAQPEATRNWLGDTKFRPKSGSLAPVPGADGRLALVVLGTGEESPGLWTHAGLPARLPLGAYRLEQPGTPDEAGKAALGWALGCYAFSRYTKAEKTFADLVWPDGADRAAVSRAASASRLVRDLVNTPAGDLGPEELADAARVLAEEHGASFAVIVGEALLKKNYPAIHAVGRAAAQAPRLIDLHWGDPDAPRLTLVGKGVCFDSGGLDLKPAGAMKTMKKDMGGAAHVLGLASMVMRAGLDVRLRVLIPAVENAVAGNAYRPLDVVPTRKGITIEIGHTDAEGRVVLADALAEASSEKPQLLIDFATLTGAARVALGPELPALFTDDNALADEFHACALAEEDPLWRLPLWRPYRKLIDGKTATLTNSADTPHAGAITAALFLAEFVDRQIPYAHFDVMAWNTAARPGRPEGGEAMAMRAAYAVIAARFGG
ncbi:MAG: leucyl aminopeptidase family protein [Alphaproteobacteria bacterium]